MNPEKTLDAKHAVANAIRNDLSSAIHWPTLENTKFHAQTHYELRQKADKRIAAAGEMMRIELKLKRICFTLFYHRLLCPIHLSRVAAERRRRRRQTNAYHKVREMNH